MDLEALKKSFQGWLTRLWLRELCRFGPYMVGKRISKELDSLNYLWKGGFTYFFHAYNEPHRTVWTSLFVPSELIQALGLIPFSLEVTAALFAGIGRSPIGLTESDSSGIPTDVCSFHKSALGFAFKGHLPWPLCQAATSSLCDSNLKMIRICESITGKNTIILDVPYDLTKTSIEYLAVQLERLAEQLAEASGRKLDMDKVQEVFDRANRTREKMLAINELRVSPFSPLPGTNALGFMLPSHAFMGSELAENFYTMLHKEIKDRIEEKERTGAVPEKKIRLLWLELKPYFSCDVPMKFEQEGKIKIAFEETNYVYWDPLDPKRPFESLARKLIQNHYNGPLECRLEVLKMLVRKYDIHGAIVFSQWGCRRNNAAVPAIKKELNKMGIPLLSLDGDCVDENNYMSGQFSTRLEGFLEMLKR